MSNPNQPPTLQQANESYYPKGYEESAALKRARKPYQVRNLLTGGAVLAFIVSVYFYSISAVKQDDFSDVVDLLPPPEERAKIRSIEDELRDKELGMNPSAAAALGTASPMTPIATGTGGPTGVMAWLKPLHEREWVQRRGWVEKGKGNVLVWGAPNVDNIGRMRDAFPSAGPRKV